MKKNLFILVLFNFSLLFGQIKIAYTKSFSSMPLLYMMENYLSVDDKELQFYSCSDSKDMVKKLLNNQIDICLLPVSVIAKMSQSGNDKLICLGVSQQSNFYIVTKNQNLNDLQTLQKEKIYLEGQDSITDVISKFYLSNTDLSFDYSYSNSQIPSLIINDKILYGILPEPYASICQNYDLQTIRTYPLNNFIQEESNQSYPIMLLTVKKSFLEENTESINSFIQIFSESSRNIIENPESCADLLQKYNFYLDYQDAVLAIKSLTFEFIQANQAKEDIEKVIKLYLEKNLEDTEINLPIQDFYY